MEKRHLLIRLQTPTQIDGEVRSGEDIIAHIITDIDLHTLASMIRHNRVIVSEVEPVQQTEPDTGSGEGSGETELAGSTTDETAAGPSLQSEPESGKLPEDSASDLVAYYVANGIAESAAETLAEAVANQSVKDSELLRTIEGIREWVAKGYDLSDIPNVGRVRKVSIEKAIEA